VDSYWVIPSADKPKLVIPRRPRRAAAAAVRNYKTAASAREQLRITALAWAVRFGLAEGLPDRVEMVVEPGVASDDIRSHLCRTLGRPVWVSLYIGPARAVRKPVLQLLDERGTTFAFAKLGVDPFTAQLVRAEATSVAMLAGMRWTTLSVPTVIHAGSWQGLELLVQSAFPRGRQATSREPLLGRAMNELARALPVQTTPLGDSDYWRALVSRVETLPPSTSADLLRRGLSDLARRKLGTQLEFGASHGDWTPWNMTISQGRAQVWDWEKFERGVPIGFDAVHYAVQGDVVINRLTPAAAFRSCLDSGHELLAPLGANARHARMIVRLYACDIAARYLLDRELDAGSTRMAELGNWLGAVIAMDDGDSAGMTEVG
jgi:hypothetical protein